MGNYLISKKVLEGKLFPFCSPQTRAENEIKWKTWKHTGNKRMNASTGWIGLAHVANNQAVASKGWIVRYFPRAPGFSWTNFQKNQEQNDPILAGSKWDFLLHEPLTTYNYSTLQGQKINKIMLLTSP